MMKNSTQRLTTLIFNASALAFDKRVRCPLRVRFAPLQVRLKTNDESCFAPFFCLMSLSTFGNISNVMILKTLRSKTKTASLRLARKTKDKSFKTKSTSVPSVRKANYMTPFGSNSRALHCVQLEKQKIKVLKAKNLKALQYHQLNK